MFLFVLNSDSFVSSSVQITRVRQKQARLRRVGLGGGLGHFLSLNTFQITKKFPHPLHSPLFTPVPSIFGFHMLWYLSYSSLSAGSGNTASDEIHSFRLYKAQLGKWLAVSESSHDRTHEHLTHPCPFPPLPPLQLADLSHPLLAYRTARTVWFWLMPLSMSGLVPLCLCLPLPPPPQAAQVFDHTKLYIEKVVKTSNFARFSSGLFFCELLPSLNIVLRKQIQI